MLGILVSREARAERRQLEQHATRLAEVDRVKPEAIDYGRRPGARADHPLAPGFVLVVERGPSHMVDASRPLDLRLRGWLVVGVGAAPKRAASLPAVVPRLERKRVLEQAERPLGVGGISPYTVEAMQRQLRRNLGMVGDQRRVAAGVDRQLVLEALEVA